MSAHSATMPRRATAWRGRAIAAAAATTILVTMAAGMASAHVVVSSPDAAAGAEGGRLTFRVPNESDEAGTVKFTVRLPQDSPFARVSAQVKPGWEITTKSRSLPSPVEVQGFTLDEAVATITWTASGQTQIGPGEFDEFALSVGPFPAEERTLVFPAIQTYSDGAVVAWDEPQGEGEPEPEHPAPALDLADPAGVSGHGSHHHEESESAETEVAASDGGSGPSDTAARVLAGLAVVLGVSSLAVATRPRRTRATAQ